jgi:hypothetical protein
MLSRIIVIYWKSRSCTPPVKYMAGVECSRRSCEGYKAKKRQPPRPASTATALPILRDEPTFCSPGSLPVVAAAPAAPVASPVSVTGALTTTTDVDVRTDPSGAVV